MDILVNIFLLAGGFCFLLGAIIHALNITNDNETNKIHIYCIRTALIFVIIGLILNLIT